MPITAEQVEQNKHTHIEVTFYAIERLEDYNEIWIRIKNVCQQFETTTEYSKSRFLELLDGIFQAKKIDNMNVMLKDIEPIAYCFKVIYKMIIEEHENYNHNFYKKNYDHNKLINLFFKMLNERFIKNKNIIVTFVACSYAIQRKLNKDLSYFYKPFLCKLMGLEPDQFKLSLEKIQEEFPEKYQAVRVLINQRSFYLTEVNLKQSFFKGISGDFNARRKGLNISSNPTVEANPNVFILKK